MITSFFDLCARALVLCLFAGTYLGAQTNSLSHSSTASPQTNSKLPLYGFDNPENYTSLFREQSSSSSVLNVQSTTEILELLSPSQGAVVPCPSNKVELRWHSVAGVTSYFVQVASDSAMTTLLAQGMVDFDTVFNATISAKESDYFWRISSGSLTSEIRKFSTRFAKQVVLQSLFKGSSFVSDTVAFRWYRDPAASAYDLQLSSKGEILRDSTTSDSTVILVLPRELMILWKVRSVCRTGPNAWSTPDSLFISANISDVSSTENRMGLQLFPNPVSDFLKIPRTDIGADNNTVGVHNTTGQIMQVPTVSFEDHWMIDCSSLQNGIYSVSIVLGSDSVRVARFVVVH